VITASSGPGAQVTARLASRGWVATGPGPASIVRSQHVAAILLTGASSGCGAFGAQQQWLWRLPVMLHA
jgi:hypothetical protein